MGNYELEFWKEVPEFIIDADAMFKAVSDPGGDPRVVALTASAYLESYLHELLKSYLPGLTRELADSIFASDRGPLGSAGNRRLIAQGLGLLDQRASSDLKHIFAIRNQFAHNVRVSFDDNPVYSLCRKLSDEGSGFLASHMTNVGAPPDDYGRSPQYRYVTCAVALATSMIARLNENHHRGYASTSQPTE